MFPILVIASIGMVSAQISMEDRVVRYRGDISFEKNNKLFVSVSGQDIEKLVITSPGGEVEAGIELGKWIFDNQIDVEITEYCLSSCANYVFTAAANKIIRPGAIVAWHGNYTHLQHTGLWRGDIDARMLRTGEGLETATARTRSMVDRLVSLERDFFENIGVDQFLCWVGKMPPHNAPDYYFLSAKDMARFGVTRVREPTSYKDTDVSRFSSDIRYIVLGQ